jgi:hypothetical protein
MTLASEGLSLPERMHTRRMNGDGQPVPVGDGITMSVQHDLSDAEMDDDSGITHNDDGSITVDDPPQKEKAEKSDDFDANLAVEIAAEDESILNTLASELLEAIESDLSSRKEWEETFSKGIDLLGLKIESPSSDVSGGGGNISKVKDPLLLEAVLRYQSNFNAEMLPADGPVKVRDDKTQPLRAGGAGGDMVTPPASPPQMGHNGGPPMNGAPVMGVAPGGPMGGTAPPPPPPGALTGAVMRSDLAEALQKDFNHYLTVIDKPYYADTDRMSFSQALGGLAFKKIYVDPLEDRPVSRFVQANHIIVNNGASSLHDAKRVTHETPNMSRITMKRMMLKGIYRDIDLSQPTSEPGSIDAKIKETEGRQNRNERPEDRDHVVLECYCYLDLKGYEHEDEDGEQTGLPLPYRVTIEKDSREILEIRRDWKEGDEDHKRRRHFVKYPLFPGLGFYDYGYVHILGNSTRVLSAIESLMVDGGMFSNFPGGLIDKMAARQEKNQMRPGPGGFLPIDTGGRPIQQVVMGMPYKDISPALMQLAQALETNARKLGSIAELPLGEGRADVPVGTVIALIEQSTKLLSAVHKRNHSAQQEEFEILKELFMEDPEALTRLAENPAHKWETEAEFKDINLVPASDPNISSHILRVMRAQAVVQMAQQAPPGLFNPKEVATRALRVLGEEDIEALFLPPPPPGAQPPSPHMVDAQSKMMALKQKAASDQQTNAAKLQMQQLEMQDHAADRASKEQIERERLSQQAMKDAREFASDVTPPDSLLPPDAGGRPSFGP